MNWVLVLDDDAKKQLSKIPKEEARRIGEAIDGMLVDPYVGDIHKVGGEKEIWRRRVGNYRILYELYKIQRIVHIFEIRRRTSQTY